MPKANEPNQRVQALLDAILEERPLTEREFTLLHHLGVRRGYGCALPVLVSMEDGAMFVGDGTADSVDFFTLHTRGRAHGEPLTVPEAPFSTGRLAHPEAVVMMQAWPWDRVVECVGAAWVADERGRLDAQERHGTVIERQEAEHQLGGIWQALRRHFETARGLLYVLDDELTRALADSGEPGHVSASFGLHVDHVWDHLVRGEPADALLEHVAWVVAHAIYRLDPTLDPKREDVPADGADSTETRRAAAALLKTLARAQVGGLREVLRHRDALLASERTARAVVRWLLTIDVLEGRATAGGDWLQPVLDKYEKEDRTLASRLTAESPEVVTPAEELDPSVLRAVLSTPASRYRRVHELHRRHGQLTWKEAHERFVEEWKQVDTREHPHETPETLRVAFHRWVRQNAPSWHAGGDD